MPLSGAPDFTTLLWRIILFTGDRTLLLSDEFAFLQSNTAGGTQTVTIPPNSDVDFSVGMQISFEQKNTALLDIEAGVGVSLDSRGALLTANGQFAVFSIVQDEIDNWIAFGDLA